MNGTIVTVLERRAVSFIMKDDKNEEVFAHISDYPNRTFLPKGSRVSFELGAYAGRTKAINIRPITPAAPNSEPTETV